MDDWTRARLDLGRNAAIPKIVQLGVTLGETRLCVTIHNMDGTDGYTKEEERACASASATDSGVARRQGNTGECDEAYGMECVERKVM